MVGVPVTDGPCWLRHGLYRANLALPRVETVLVGAIFIMLQLGYRTVYVLGADHSWHEDVVVDRSNRVCLRDRHFYDTGETKLIPFFKDPNETTTFTMHETYRVLGKMFKGYFFISDYARYLNAKIYNASDKTYIDAFDRYDLKNWK